jgi:hypothetical protein
MTVRGQATTAECAREFATTPRCRSSRVHQGTRRRSAIAVELAVAIGSGCNDQVSAEIVHAKLRTLASINGRERLRIRHQGRKRMQPERTAMRGLKSMWIATRLHS